MTSASTSDSTQLPIAVDAMGGDFGPAVVVEGAVAAARDLNIKSIIVGDEKEILPRLRALGVQDSSLISVVHASEVITMDDHAAVAIRRKRDASIRVAFELVKDGKAGGVVSPGNTGAMMAAGIAISGTLPGIARPAIATLIPRVGDLPPTVLLDSGANVDCRAHQLVQFAVMGVYYARSVINKNNPRVGLVSNGTEPGKGNDITRAAALMLSEIEEIQYVGYVEGRDICRDVADVVVCDGFVGNIMLKTIEGAVELVVDSMRHHVGKTTTGKLGLWLIKPRLKSLFKEKLDPSTYGGAPLLGLNHIGVVCHGSSNSRAIKNGIRVADKFMREGLVGKLSGALGLLEQGQAAEYEDGVWGRMGERFEKKKRKVVKETQATETPPAAEAPAEIKSGEGEDVKR